MNKNEAEGKWYEREGIQQKFATLTETRCDILRRQERRVAWETSIQTWKNKKKITGL